MYQPKRPALVAIGLLVVFVLILGWPLLQGQWLVGPYSDQVGGFAVRDWAAQQWRATGSVPLWSPMIFGGLPYVATLGHGDVFYPVSFLRLVLSSDLVLGIWFVTHTILAGIAAWLFLRRIGVSWTGSVAGGLAYQLTGIVISMPSPGHDGKLAVSAILPLAFLALYAAVRERRAWGYGLWSVVVALAMLSPHVQMTFYLLIASGLFSLYCAFGEPGDEPIAPRVGRLAIALGAVGVGFGVAAPQLLPFFEYIPHSPRAESFRDFAGSASYAIPWDHVPELLIGGFSGDGRTYWGSNPIKLHSEYLGLPVIALALLGFAAARRRMIWWLAGIAMLFLLISLGSATPFYRIWWTVMPMVKQTRAPGMAFFIVAFIVAVYAAFGVERLERGEGKGMIRGWMIAAAAGAVLALAGAFGGLAEGLAPASNISGAFAHAGAIRTSALLGAIALGLLAALAWAREQGRLPAVAFALGLPLVIGADLWRDGRHFWSFQPPAREGLYRDDALIRRMKERPLPYRVLDLTALMGGSAYPVNVLQGHGIPQVLGYFGFEHRYYDDLLGGQNEWRNLLSSTRLWDLLAVNFVITPDTIALPGYHLVLGPERTAAGAQAFLYEADSAPPYARVVPAAVKTDEERIPATLADARLPGFDRFVLLPPNAPVTAPNLETVPEPSPARARVSAWRPGAMTIELDPAPPAAAYLLVSENWYLDWHATVDGADAPVLRGNASLITVPLPAGARRVELVYRSARYRLGKLVSFASLLVIAGLVAAPFIMKPRSASSV